MARASSSRAFNATTAATARRTGIDEWRMARVLITRRIPSSVLSRLESEHSVDIYDGDGTIPRDELLRRVADKDALISVLTDRIDAEVLDAAPTVRIVANIAVGYENIDVP